MARQAFDNGGWEMPAPGTIAASVPEGAAARQGTLVATIA
jgi:hypothetical protein